ncbi:MFS transporter [Corynebacterium sp. 3HC-13]|uniref:MFS transporter n=1 Tax=Corynebacterium poyangense TaxID=2684405 RepID=UPI001CCE24C4|nr:MFS transporter [Corynebacterium poyangense]MBZ8178386.1 MFS transporter [Corynebacterium poyangense]
MSSTSQLSSSPPSAEKTKQQRKATLGAFVGTSIEWYDFYIFGTAAALVFGKLFYPDLAAGAGLIASFATFWVGFIARPIGGLIFSHFGDRFGRKNTLVVTLLLMGAGTFAIGCLPTYSSIGIAAPILLLLLRTIQGIAVGGEWGGAVVLATEGSEHSKRGMAGAWVQQGAPMGSIAATAMFLLVGFLPDHQFLNWGWRIPFLFSAVMVFVAFYIRRQVEETPEFQEVQKQNKVSALPLKVVLKNHWKAVLAALFAPIMGIGMAFFFNTFLLSWTTGSLGMNRQSILNLLLVASIVQFLWQPVAARIAERYSIKMVMISALCATILLAPLLFWALQSGNFLALCIATLINYVTGTAYYALLPAALAAAFPPEVRYTGISTGYQLSAMIFSGSIPMMGQWILRITEENAWMVMVYYIILLAMSIAGVVALLRQAHQVRVVHQADPN